MGFITMVLAIFVVILLYLLVNRYSIGGSSMPPRHKPLSKETTSTNKSDEEVEVIYRCLEKVTDNRKKDESSNEEERKSENKARFVERNEAENMLAGIASPINASLITPIHVDRRREKSNVTSMSKTRDENIDKTISMQPTTKGNYIMNTSGETPTSIAGITTDRINVALPATESFERLLNTALPLSDTSTTSSIAGTDNSNVSNKRSVSNGSGEVIRIETSKNIHPSTTVTNTPQCYSGNKDIDAIIYDAQKKAEKALEETQKLQCGNVCGGQPIKAEIQRTELCQVQVVYSQDVPTGNGMEVLNDTSGQYKWSDRDDRR